VITEEQFFEAVKIEGLQISLKYWEKKRTDKNLEEADKLAEYYSKELEGLTGNRRGFLNKTSTDNAPQGE
jgi:hypothetical protein